MKIKLRKHYIIYNTQKKIKYFKTDLTKEVQHLPTESYKRLSTKHC